jgi:hypothetical protein
VEANYSEVGEPQQQLTFTVRLCGVSEAFDEKIPPTSSPTIYFAPPDIDEMTTANTHSPNFPSSVSALGSGCGYAAGLVTQLNNWVWVGFLPI